MITEVAVVRVGEPRRRLFGIPRQHHTSCSGVRASERSTTESTSVKIAVFAPIPSASESTANAVKARFFRRMRKA